MTNNSTQLNITESGCAISWDISQYWLYTFIVCSVASFVGNVLIILTVYKTKTLRTTTNYIIVSMAISDVFEPAFDLLILVLFIRDDAPVLKQNVGAAFCKISHFLLTTSYGVSMSSLVVITVQRFYAVTFPMRARFDHVKTRVVVLMCTWIGPIAFCCPIIYYYTYKVENMSCYATLTGLSEQHYVIWKATLQLLYFVLPFIFMLILYPVIVVKLATKKVPGNSSTLSQVIKRRKQNIRSTNMFITIVVLLVLTYGTYQVVDVIHVFSFVSLSARCVSLKIYFTVYPFPAIFHAINPVIYFIFCSSYRQGIKQIFSCCCHQSIVRRSMSGGEQIEL